MAQGEEYQVTPGRSAPCFVQTPRSQKHLKVSVARSQAPCITTGALLQLLYSGIQGSDLQKKLMRELPRVTQKEDQHLGPNKPCLVA